MNTCMVVNYQPFALNSTATIVKGNNQYKIPLPNDNLIGTIYTYCNNENIKDVYFLNIPEGFIEKFQEEIAEETYQNNSDEITIRRFENEVSN